jgi:gliding motility-associated-like protein
VLENNHIEDLFKEAFKNYEEPVRPELWTKIASSIPSAPVQPGIDGGVANTITQSSSLFSAFGTWIAGAALVAVASVGIYYLVQPKSTNSELEQVTEKSVASEILPETISSTQPSETSVVNNSVTGNNNEKSLSSNIQPSQKQSTTSSVSAERATELSNNQSESKGQEGHNSEIAIEQQSSKPQQSAPVPSGISTSAVAGNSSGITKLIANPSSGIAPLEVSLNYTGESAKLEWNFGDGNTSLSNNGIQHTFEKPGIYIITLKTTDESGKVKILNQNIEVKKDLTIQNIPNIFTPNNDGRNDIFRFETADLTDLEVSIYDKSGKFVYKWTGTENGWDGRLNNGQLATEGTYFYIIFAAGENNRQHQQKGTINLKR